MFPRTYRDPQTPTCGETALFLIVVLVPSLAALAFFLA
jgi:hypothetical protein